MVNEGRARLFQGKAGKYLVYLSIDSAEDIMLPFKKTGSIFEKVSFKLGENKIAIEKWLPFNKQIRIGNL